MGATPHPQNSQPWEKSSSRPTIGGSAPNLGAGARHAIADGIHLLKRRPSMSLDRRGGEHEARRRDFITWPEYRRIERLHNRYK